MSASVESLLKRRRSALKRFNEALERINRQLDQQADSATIRISFENLSKLKDSFLSVQEDVEVLLDDEETFEAQFEEGKEPLEAYQEIHEEVARREDAAERQATSDSLTSNATNQASTPNTAPTATYRSIFTFTPDQLPAFEGDPLKFASFWDRFKAEVHNNPELSVVRKYGILASCLKGPAASMIEGLSQTEANYQVVIDLLFSRYHVPRVVVEAHINAIVDMEPKTGPDDLRELLDKSEAHTRSLTALGRNIDNGELPACEIIVPLLKRKLPESTLKKWEIQMLKDATDTSVTRFLGFLRQEVQLEELLQVRKGYKKSETSVKQSPRQSRGPKWRQRKSGEEGNEHTATFAAQTSDVLKRCPFCEGDCHEQIELCPKVSILPFGLRFGVAKRNHLCFKCLVTCHSNTECTAIGCCVPDCKYSHHKLLHRSKEARVEKPSEQKNVKANAASSDRGIGILQTVKAEIDVSDVQRIPVSVLLDAGSDSSFITASLAETLGFKGKAHRFSLDTVGSQTHIAASKSVSFKLGPVGNPGCDVNMTALTLRRVASVSKVSQINVEHLQHLRDLQLAPLPNGSGVSVDVLIGADYYYDFLTGQIAVGQIGEPAAVETIFGWIVGGPNPQKPKSNVLRIRTCTVDCSDLDSDRTLQKFWELEDGGIASTLDANLPQDRVSDEVLRTFKETTRFVGDRYEVRLPWKADVDLPLPNNYGVALECLKRSERKHSQSAKAMKAYDEAINEYVKLGFAELVPDEQANQPEKTIWYLPHHAVIREDRETTKVRIVFNGASKYKGVSLNASLHTGPSLLPSIIGILLRFRGHAVAFTGDIKKMFLQVSVHPEDRDALRYLWRDESGKLQILRFLRVIFGTNCSPFLAIASVRNHCDKKQDVFPIAAEMVKRNMYMDDLASGANSVDKAKQAIKDCREMLLSGGFELAKWTTNCPEALDGVIRREDQSAIMNKPAGSRVQKILGVIWRLSEDVLGVQYQEEQERPYKLTKRSLLKDVASIFDPIGITAPYAITGRILLQDCWKEAVGWDDGLPQVIEAKYLAWRAELTSLHEIVVPRHMFKEPAIKEGDIELHGFGDASVRAYGVVIYMKYQSTAGPVIQFLLAKSRVAPIKGVTLPKLELTAALLTARLLHFVLHEVDLPINPNRVYAWADSEIALHWIVGAKSNDTFVKNRVDKIRTLVPAAHWRHCPGRKNPADEVSRGVSLAKLVNNDEWLHGPRWLWQSDAAAKPSFRAEETKVTANAVVQPEPIAEPIFDVLRFPLHEALAITAYVKRFVDNVRKDNSDRRLGPLSPEEYKNAELYWIKLAQAETYPREAKALKEKNPLPRDSTILKLDPQIDDCGTLRVGGRIALSAEAYSTRHPLILPKGKIAKRIIERTHLQTLHTQTDHLLAILRKTYWIPKGRSFVKSVIRECPICRKFSTRPMSQKMGDLPSERVMIAPPFENSGVDFAGPLQVKGSEGSVKAYICLFVCMSTRAVHLELVSDLSVDKFMQALRRMNCRRGPSRLILSDNAKTFKAAEKILNKSQVPLAEKGIAWRYIPERAPWQGGMYERLVRSIKTPLRKVLGSALLTFEELLTVLCEVESQVNSRPLSIVSDEVQDFEAITPAHFLAGRAVTTADIFNMNLVGEKKTTLRQRWRHMQQVSTNIWKRWRREYLVTLQQRVKWNQSYPNIKEDDVVLVEDEGHPRGVWPIGVVQKVSKGRDGLARSATIRKKGGKMVTRPIQRLYLLEAKDE